MNSRSYFADGIRGSAQQRDPRHLGGLPCTIVTLRFVVENDQKTIWGSCENVIFIRNAGTNPKVMAVRSKANANRKNLIMSLADSCFEFFAISKRNTIPTSFAAALRSLPKTSATTVDQSS